MIKEEKFYRYLIGKYNILEHVGKGNYLKLGKPKNKISITNKLRTFYVDTKLDNHFATMN